MRKDNKAACVFVKITKRILTLEEKADPDVFAENVRQLMSNEAGIPMADHSAMHYLEEIKRIREFCQELKASGWRKFARCKSEKLTF